MSRDLNLDYWEPLEKARAERDEARRELAQMKTERVGTFGSEAMIEVIRERDEWRKRAEASEIRIIEARVMFSGILCGVSKAPLDVCSCIYCVRFRALLAERKPARNTDDEA